MLLRALQFITGSKQKKLALKFDLYQSELKSAQVLAKLNEVAN